MLYVAGCYMYTSVKLDAHVTHQSLKVVTMLYSILLTLSGYLSLLLVHV